MSLKSIIFSLQKEISDRRSSTATCSSQTMKIQDESFEAIVQKLEDRMQRKSNIMLHGLVEPPQDVSVEVGAQTDIQNVEDVLQFVDNDAQLDVRRVFRNLNRPNGKPRPVNIILGSDAAVHQFLFRSKQLKNTENIQIYFLHHILPPSKTITSNELKQNSEKERCREYPNKIR
ncbi:hypothetical protein WA026_015386 [Henosepilachna vigintioctopunctata]|uniref:Uncharacterized protein n=1 Tax=Henosepilachna vigintioctopunctata TaxID=420089 RepID=A0AAW1UC66_9CUCU